MADSPALDRPVMEILHISPFSTFAGNPYFISLDELIEEGVLTRAECEKVNWGKAKGSIDYEKIYKGRYPLLRKAYERSKISENPEYQKFVNENSWWLSDYALFMAVKRRFDNVEWTKMGRRYPSPLEMGNGLLQRGTVL